MNRSIKCCHGFGLLTALLLLVIGQPSTSLAADKPTEVKDNAKDDAQAKAAAAATKFDKTGPQRGDQIPDIALRTLDDEPESMQSLVRHRATLLVTGSFTCPKSRSRWPELKELAAKHKDKLQVAIIYVIEAHPIEDICPYKGVVDVTPENEREGILRRQPTTLSKRISLAKEFRDRLGIDVSIYVDAMGNTAWTALGGAPNAALLVNDRGIVVHRQGWFEAATLEAELERYQLARQKEGEHSKQQEALETERRSKLEAELKQIDISRYDLNKYFSQPDAIRAEELLTKLPELVKYVAEEVKGRGGETLFVSAVQAEAFATARLLLKHGADINWQRESAPSALHTVARRGKLSAVKFLIENKANLNLPAHHTGLTPLHEAVLHGHRDIAEALVKAGAKDDFFSATGLGNTEAVRKQLKAAPARAFIPDGHWNSPLSYAASNGHAAVVDMLLAAGAPAGDAANGWQKQPIHWAAERGHARVVLALLKAGASPNAREHDSLEYPLHLAAGWKHFEAAKALIENGADLTARSTNTRTALHVAADEGSTEIVQILLAAKADPGATLEAYDTECGPIGGWEATKETPLHLAAKKLHAQTIKALLAGGAKINAEDHEGQTPLAVVEKATFKEHYGDKIEQKEFDARRAESIKLLQAAGGIVKVAKKGVREEDDE